MSNKFKILIREGVSTLLTGFNIYIYIEISSLCVLENTSVCFSFKDIYTLKGYRFCDLSQIEPLTKKSTEVIMNL